MFNKYNRLTVLTEVSSNDLASMLRKLNIRQRPTANNISLLADIATSTDQSCSENLLI